MNYKDYLYPLARAGKVSIEEYERRIQQKDALNWGIPEIDRRVVPAMPGDLISIVARPGHAKTTLSIFLALQFSKIIREEKDIIVYATWETLVEEFVGILTAPESGFTIEDIARGNADILKIKRAIVKVLGNNIVIFGSSMENRDDFEDPSLLDLDLALVELRKQGFTIKGIVIDYIQAIPSLQKKIAGSESSRVSLVSENVFYAKRIARKHGCPTFIDVQARREVDEYGPPKFPALHDCQWSSVVEQASDKVFGLTMPAKYWEDDQKGMEIKGWTYKVKETTLCLKMLKQRFGPSASAQDMWVLELDHAKLTVFPQKPQGKSQKPLDPDDIRSALS